MADHRWPCPREERHSILSTLSPEKPERSSEAEMGPAELKNSLTGLAIAEGVDRS